MAARSRSGPGGLFLSRTPPNGGRKPWRSPRYAAAHNMQVFGDEITPKFGVKYLDWEVLRPEEESHYPKERTGGGATDEKKSGFVVQDGPWPGD